jgi:hypothetical protein
MAALTTFSEALLATLPIPLLFQLSMNPRKRWSVLFLLSLGYLVTIVGCVRTVFLWNLFNTDDLTWWTGPHWMCSEVEISVAMVG